ncbi:hypothetical protein [Neoactinobaculum massilliense]|uniref:ABC transporter ATP-binding protein n=1 Tax=Neoactinobaculum massilliense TaxID=2364794 RepID=UPI001F153DC5|nr:hypothetical protein [Neoactinobaculum massilliense]
MFENPQHPYTKALLSAVPIPDPRVERTRERLTFESDATNVTYFKGRGRNRSEVPQTKK